MSDSVSVVGYWIPYLSSTLVQGFPPPKNFIPGLQAAGLNVDFVNLYDIKQKYGGNEIKRGLAMAQSDKIILSYWDYIYNRDLNSIFSNPKKKFIFMINWNEEPRTFDQKMQILQNSKYVTLSQDHFRQQWIDELGDTGKPFHDNMVVWRFPCSVANTQLDKKKCREIIGQKTDYSIIVWGYYGCHSDDTFLYTKNGLKHWTEIEKTDLVLSVNQKDYLEWIPIEEKYTYNYDGNMILINGQRTNLFVTPNHDLILPNNQKKTAIECISKRRFHLKVTGKWNGKNIRLLKLPIPPVGPKIHHKYLFNYLPTNDVLELLGWYLSEGNLFKSAKQKAVYPQIRNCNEKNIENIIKLCEENKLPFGLYENKTKIIIFSRQLGDLFKDAGEKKLKRIPEWALELAPGHLEHLYKILMKGDGHHLGMTYYTSSVSLRNSFLELLLKIGMKGTFRGRIRDGGFINGRKIRSSNMQYQINIHNPKGYFDKRQDIKIVPYKGKIWCLKTRNGNFFTVRNGVLSLSGNSGKGHLELLEWAVPLTGTTVLFCGTPASPEAGEELRNFAFRTGIQSRVLFSKPLITDEESDVWFSAADVGVVTYWNKIGESSLAVQIGHRKAIVTSDLHCFPEYEKLGAIVMANHDDFKNKMVNLLIQPGERALQEAKATAYANQFNWMSTGLQFKKLVESM